MYNLEKNRSEGRSTNSDLNIPIRGQEDEKLHKTCDQSVLQMYFVEQRRSLIPHQLECVTEAAFLAIFQLAARLFVVRVLQNLIHIVLFHGTVVDFVDFFEYFDCLFFVALESGFLLNKSSFPRKTHGCENKFRRFGKKVEANAADCT